MASHPHLILRDIGHRSTRFQPRNGRSDTTDPAAVEDRRRHAAKLGKDLEAVARAIGAASAIQRDRGARADEAGLPMTVIGLPGAMLRVGEARRNSRTLPVLSIQRSGGRGRDRANVFATPRTIATLERALAKYAVWQSGAKPKRFNLFETADVLRPSTVADLWSDDPAKLPEGDEVMEWEVWIRKESWRIFLNRLREADAERIGDADEFVDAVVLNVVTDAGTILALVRDTGAVIELRPASTFEAEYLDYDPEERLALASGVAGRVTAPPDDAPTTVMVDTGSNHLHPMIGIALAEDDCRSIDPAWPVGDHAGHGSQMSGIALYGDVEKVVTNPMPVALTTRLASVVVTAPPTHPAVPARDAIERAVETIEGEGTRRNIVYCVAATAPGDDADGRPTGTSIMVDQLAWNDGRRTRLFCVAAGNVQAASDATFPTGPYDDRNKEYPLQAPGQALNALTVGASTSVCDGFDALAPAGDLCPSSRTSQAWDVHYANKPDIVMEGGNHEIDPGGLLSRRTTRSMLLTTGRNHPRQPFQFTGETSAATARAAGVATRLLAAYPDLRPESVRALMVNSARWTPAMLQRLAHLRRIGLSEPDAHGIMLDCYGWGAPDEERLFRSAGDALTLVVEDHLHPYVERQQPSGGRRVCLREMTSFALPWPTRALRALNQTRVTMRCTLSYFVQPDPGGAARARPDRYGSHRLRFAVKTPNATKLEFLQRINQLASEDDLDEVDTAPAIAGLTDRDSGWTGPARRNLGSIHHDVWIGRASELAQRDAVAVYPVRGWWAEGRERELWSRPVRFSLVVSIETPSSAIDITADAVAVARAKGMLPAGIVALTGRRG